MTDLLTRLITVKEIGDEFEEAVKAADACGLDTDVADVARKMYSEVSDRRAAVKACRNAVVAEHADLAALQAALDGANALRY